MPLFYFNRLVVIINIVLISVEWQSDKKPFYNKKNGYVSNIALHDTLPKN